MIEEIRAAIEQRRNAELDENGNAKDLFCAVRLWAYTDLLSILDELGKRSRPKISDNSFEEEIHREVQKLRTAPCYDELRDFARHFAELQRERLMENSLCGSVSFCGVSAWVELDSKELTEFLRSHFKDGDEVRIIIIKEEEK